MVKRVLAGLLLLAALGSGQRKVDPKNTYARIICVMPMIGRGTPDDPVRPQYAPWPPPSATQAGARGTILAFAQQVSDDGKSAIVEFVARDRSAFQSILNNKQVKVFVKGTDKKDDIEKELKKFKKDFDFNQFGVVMP
jgi:hypothetical protein